MKKLGGLLGFLPVILIILGVIIYRLCCFSVQETEQVIVTRFGKAIGDPIADAGLHFKAPFVDIPNHFSKQVLPWDGPVTEMSTKNKTYISVDTYARWKIVDVLKFYKRFKGSGNSRADEIRRANSRLDDILGSETRNTIASHNLIEVIRSTKDRQPEISDELVEASGSAGSFVTISKGRIKLEQEIFATSKEKLEEFGIELLDIRFKRINYNASVQSQIYERMKSERQQIAERFRSEGAGEAAKINGKREKDLAEIDSIAYKEVETLKGVADAKAAEIYANAFGQSKDSEQFYEFLRTMELYEQMLTGDSTVVLSTDSDMFKYLKSMEPAKPDVAR